MPRRPHLLIVLHLSALLAIAWFAYRHALATFFFNEDFIWLYRCRPALAGSLASLLWTDPMQGSYSWRPLLQLWFGSNFAAFGWNVRPYHVEIWLVHIACALAVYALACSWRGPWCATIAALVFSFHPLRVESLAWASAAGGPLSTLGVLLAVATSQRALAAGAKPWAWLCLSAASFFVALLALETALAALVWIPLLGLATVQRELGAYRLGATFGALVAAGVSFALLRGYASPALWLPPANSVPLAPASVGASVAHMGHNFVTALEALLPAGVRGAGIVLHLAGAAVAVWRAAKGDYVPLATLACFVASIAPYTPLFFGVAPRHVHLPLVAWGWFWASLVWPRATTAAHGRAVASVAVLGVWLAVAWPATTREVAHYRRLGESTLAVLREIRQALPQAPPAATLAVAGLGPLRLHQGVFVFGLEEALRLLYGDDHLRVTFVPLGTRPAEALLLVYDGAHFRLEP